MTRLPDLLRRTVERHPEAIALAPVPGQAAGGWSYAQLLALAERGAAVLRDLDLSAGDDVLAQRVGIRADIPRRHFVNLLAKASATVQKRLVAANPRAADHIRHVVADIEGKLKAAQARDYTAARARVEALRRAGKLGESEIHSFAKSEKFEETAVALSLLCGLPIEAIEQALLDERPDMVLIIAKAIGYSWATAKLMLLLRTGGLGASQHDLDLALHSFDKLQVSTAQRAVRFYHSRRSTEHTAAG